MKQYHLTLGIHFAGGSNPEKLKQWSVCEGEGRDGKSLVCCPFFGICRARDR